ncbi:MAG: HIT family protein [Planctomycetaceae bacterium]|nr:HIT family protein [Planctomycetaceae bacterium]
MTTAKCAYCDKGDALSPFGIEIQALPGADLYLFKEQSHEGRVILAAKRHVGNLTDMTDSERNAFFAEVARVGKVLEKAFSPDKINYGAYGDTSGHFHMHLVPKYRDGFEWGGIFDMNPEKEYLDDEGYQMVIETIKAGLE